MTVRPIAHESIGSARLHRLGWGEVLLWSAAFLTVLAVQALAGVLVTLWKTDVVLPGAPPPAIMLELSPVSVAPQVDDIAAEDGELALSQEPATPVEATPAETIPEAVPAPVQPLAEPETVPPLDAADAPQAIEPVREPLEAVEPVVAEPLETDVPDLVEVESAAVTLPLPRPSPATLEQKRVAYAQAKKRERQERAQQQAAAAASQQTAPRSVEAEAAERPAAAEQTTTTRRVPTISPQRWQSQVLAQLDRAKRYPPEARRRREEGIPHLQFTIDASGQVLSARIVRSSGYPALDEAALDMVHRASPLPPPPAAMAQPRITLTVPVNFNLR